MLTPEYLNLIEFNDVVELYNKLNIEITSDIIKRIARMQDIIPSSRKQLEILLQTNGIEIFNEALEKTSMLTSETKKELKQLFTDMAKEDIQGYKELYQYKNKLFKLSESQYKILNQGLKQTNKTLSNLTNTIAFQSKQAYVETIDMAYMKVITGAFDYNTAINSAVQQLANKGITLKDRLGRNVQLEVAVRRNIMAGIQKTANEINRDIEDELGCDGYEVTAHIGARPSHAEEQGKQFAINSKDAEKFNVGKWDDVKDLWEEYNCRHSYFGIILGISEPQYTDKELKEMKNATVELNGKEIPYYEATQKQRAIENNIRKVKGSIQALEKAEQDATIQKAQLTQLNKQLNKLCNETGLKKDSNRTKIANYQSTKVEKYDKITVNNIFDKSNINIQAYKANNNIQEQISKLLNMDGKPTVVNKEKFEQIKGIEITRYLRDYKNQTAEKAYINTLYGEIKYSDKQNSQYGRGIYFGEKKNAEELLYTYGNGKGKAINAKISPEAKIIEFNSMISYIKDVNNRTKALPEELRKIYENERSLLYMLDGYDGIKINGKGYYCIYNRKVLIIKNE